MQRALDHLAEIRRFLEAKVESNGAKIAALVEAVNKRRPDIPADALHLAALASLTRTHADGEESMEESYEVTLLQDALDTLNLVINRLHPTEADLSYLPELIARHERRLDRLRAFTFTALGPRARSVRHLRIGRRANDHGARRATPADERSPRP